MSCLNKLLKRRVTETPDLHLANQRYKYNLGLVIDM